MSPQRWRRREADRAPCPRRISRFVEPALLLLLHRGPGHGYGLMEGLRSLGLEKYPIDSSAIYRALRRLENAGIVKSDWDTEIAAGPPRRMYTITALGEDYLADWVEDLKATDSVLHVFLDAYEAGCAPGRYPGSRGHDADRGTPADAWRASASMEGCQMKVVVCSEGPGLDAATSPVFGRCPMYVFVDTDTMNVVSISNPAQNAPGGAGIEAAQFVVSEGAQAVIAGNVGPNACTVLSGAGVPAYLVGQSTVAQAVEDFGLGRLSQLSLSAPSRHSQTAATSGRSRQPRDRELAALAAEAAELRKRLAAILTRINELDKED